MIEFYSGLADIANITHYHNLVCLPGAPLDEVKRVTPYPHNPIQYMIDSPAFHHMSKGKRVSNQEAIEEQMKAVSMVGYSPFMISTYDDLVDEKLVHGRLIKMRVSSSEAELKVKNTVESARYYASQRNYLNSKILFAAQGIGSEQYTHCIKEILPHAQKGDVIGYGGFCILGRQKTYIPEALHVFQDTLPLIAQVTNRVHIYGVVTLDVLYLLSQMCDNLSIQLSTDSTVCSRAARLGEYLTLNGRRDRIVATVYDKAISENLAIWNVLMVRWLLADIKNRYKYRGKKGWLSAIDFEFTQSNYSRGWWTF